MASKKMWDVEVGTSSTTSNSPRQNTCHVSWIAPLINTIGLEVAGALQQVESERDAVSGSSALVFASLEARYADGPEGFVVAAHFVQDTRELRLSPNPRNVFDIRTRGTGRFQEAAFRPPVEGEGGASRVSAAPLLAFVNCRSVEFLQRVRSQRPFEGQHYDGAN